MPVRVGLSEKMSRNRNFCFTFNNYPDTTLVDQLDCKYIAYSKEVAPTTGTPHLQGWVTFKNAKTHKQVCKLMPGCHISVMIGSLAENDIYCSKAAELTERGEKPISNDNKGRAEQMRWQRAREFAKEGNLDAIDADIFIRHYSALKRISTDYVRKPKPVDVRCYWVYGSTGTGKSHAVETTYPDCYKKNMDDPKWFCGYQGEDVVYLEDIDKYQVKWGGMLKRLCDKWPLLVNVKGSMVYIRPRVVIITSNYRIEEIWQDSGTLEPLLRRFTEIEKLDREQLINFN